MAQALINYSTELAVTNNNFTGYVVTQQAEQISWIFEVNMNLKKK